MAGMRFESRFETARESVWIDPVDLIFPFTSRAHVGLIMPATPTHPEPSVSNESAGGLFKASGPENPLLSLGFVWGVIKKGCAP